MAKASLSQLKTIATAYVAANKQASGTAPSSVSEFTGLIDKIGKQVVVQNSYNNKLNFMIADELTLGKIIEETMVDLVLPIAYEDGTDEDYDASKALKPYDVTFEDAAYSYDLGRKVIPVTRRYDVVEQGSISSENAGALIAGVMKSFNDSQTMYEYNLCKQLIGNAVDKANAAGRTTTLAVPTDTATGEAFIKELKRIAEDASFPTEDTSLSGALIGAAPSLVCFINKGVMPSIEVDTLAGAFNKEDLAVNIKFVVVDDIPTDGDSYAFVCDERMLKLHPSYVATRSQENGLTDYVNFFKHTQFTGYISKHTYCVAINA